MKLADFSYELPDALIARYPAACRSASRLLCLDRQTGAVSHYHFYDLPELLKPEDLLVCNDTKVIPARLWGKKITGGKVEILIERLLDAARFLAHVRGSGALQPGAKIFLQHEVVLTLVAKSGALCELRVVTPQTVSEILETQGEIPLPPYLNREPDASDIERYQTIFAREQGSVAAPTAGLHFDGTVMDALKKKNVRQTSVTLHVGAGTFAPVKTENITAHRMHAERASVSDEVCALAGRTKSLGGRVIAVGTTAVRSLETASLSGTLQPFSGETEIFIYPGFEFHCIDGMITNFHLPRSTLLMLVSAFAGYENIMRAYEIAVKEQYRFFSYGDAMLIL